VTDLRIPAWVDGTLRPSDKLEVHRRGWKHLAVSVFVLAGDHLLIQRRALGKYHTPGLWANTCCTHPHWGEPPLDCAVRRLDEELGLGGMSPEHAGQIEYRADVGNGMTEHELVEVFVARLGGRPDLAPDPAEVMETRWVLLDELATETRNQPHLYTPWLRIYLADHSDLIFGPR
jgi:isopentenyl-diphosphate Delta-isomerase